MPPFVVLFQITLGILFQKNPLSNILDWKKVHVELCKRSSKGVGVVVVGGGGGKIV